MNSPYEYPSRHWELDQDGQPTQHIIEQRRSAQFITPIPKPRKQKGKAHQQQFVLDEGLGLSSEGQGYDATSIINGVREHVDNWRRSPNPKEWHVTAETARLLQHWRSHDFQSIRSFFCQVEAVETLIWMTEVAPKTPKASRDFLDHLTNASETANPGLLRWSLRWRLDRERLPLWGLSQKGQPSYVGGIWGTTHPVKK
ncbi:MAG: hypothetical protein C7B44_12800 [Sulfobacillus thermosulfidooxidans]|nr:MAG: hypothetical protein C7B44_12800 [Sulfobacillus thermosulfidooxidans]